MNSTPNRRWLKLSQRIASLVLGISLILTLTLTGSVVAQAAPKLPTDENRSMENTPRPAKWYDDQRSIDSYIDNADVNSKGNLVERSKDKLRNAADNVREKLSADRSEDSDQNSLTDVKERAGDRIEQAKEVFEEATDKAFKQPLDRATGTNR
ncbi:MAG TPA: hypothetical protein V6C57_02140 [Coleofasciculaceae cyanobacterium]